MVLQVWIWASDRRSRSPKPSVAWFDYEMLDVIQSYLCDIDRKRRQPSEYTDLNSFKGLLGGVVVVGSGTGTHARRDRSIAIDNKSM